MANFSAISSKTSAVQLVLSEDGAFLIDIEHDRIHKLNRSATEIWTLLSEAHSELQIVHIIAQKYGADEAHVAADVRSVIGKIADLQLSPRQTLLSGVAADDHHDQTRAFYPWYGQTAGEIHPAKATALLVFGALFGLTMFDMILAVSSLKYLCLCVSIWPVRKRKRTDHEIVGTVCAAVQQACVWYPKRALCLQRSAVTTCFLKLHGFAAEMVVGIRDMPFMAHAWVEMDHQVVNDWPGVRKFYRSARSQVPAA